MIDINRTFGIDSLVQDLYTPANYNPAEYTLLGYDPSADVLGMSGGAPMYGAGAPMDGGAPMYGAGAPVDGVASMPATGQSNADYNQAIEDLAAQNRATYLANNPETVWDPSQGIAALNDPFEQERVLREADYRGLIWDEQRKNAWDAMGNQIYKDGKGARAQRDITFRYGPDGRIKYAQYEGP